MTYITADEHLDENDLELMEQKSFHRNNGGTKDQSFIYKSVK